MSGRDRNQFHHLGESDGGDNEGGAHEEEVDDRARAQARILERVRSLIDTRAQSLHAASVKCPLCNTLHQPTEPVTIASLGSCFAMSNDARPTYLQNHVCPVCWETPAEAELPMVHLACGHVICKGDFGKMGGTVRELEQPQSRTMLLLQERTREVSRTEGGVRQTDVVMEPFVGLDLSLASHPALQPEARDNALVNRSYDLFCQLNDRLHDLHALLVRNRQEAAERRQRRPQLF